MTRFKRGKNWAGHRVTLDGELFFIDSDYRHDGKWCHIAKADGSQRRKVSAEWAAWRAAVFVADQSLVGQSFELAGDDGPVFWPCVDRYKGSFTLEEPGTGHRVSFSTAFLDHWKPTTAAQSVAVNAKAQLAGEGA